MIKKLFLILIFASVFTVLILAGKLAWAAASKGSVTLSDTISSSGTGPNGIITINASVNNAYTGYYWYKRIGAQVDSDTRWNSYSTGYGTGMTGSFSFTGLGGGSHQATSKATLYYWNGSRYVFWADLSNGPTTVNIPNPAPQISVDLKVDPDGSSGPASAGDGPYSVVQGTFVRVVWSYQNATNCTATNWTGLTGETSGGTGEQVNSDVTYDLSCRNADTGQTASDSVTVTTTPAPPLPTASITASLSVSGAYSEGPISVAYNNAAYLKWSSTDATSCSVSPGGWTGTSNSTGQSTGNLTANTIYTLTCGTATDTVTVNVAAPAFNYTLSSPDPGNITSVKGATGGSNTITVTKTAGTAAAVTLRTAWADPLGNILSLPPEVTAAFSQSPCTPNLTCTSTLTLTATSAATAGTYTIGVLGSPLDKATGFYLVVNEPGLSASCSVNKTQSTINESVTWTAAASGGTGTYAYTWGGTAPLSGKTGATADVTYISAGAGTDAKTGSVTVTSGGLTTTSACSNSVDVYTPALDIEPSSVPVSPDKFRVDETRQLAVDYYPYGLSIATGKQDITTSASSTWSSIDATIVSVNSTGLITGIGVGTNKKINVVYTDSYGNSVITSTADGTNTSVTVSPPETFSVSIKTYSNTPGAILTDQDITFKATGGIGGYKWSGGGTPDKDQSGLNSEFKTKYTTSGSKTITVVSGSQTKTLPVTVANPTLTIDSLTAVPATGKTALNVSLDANTTSNIEGTANYTFWWDCVNTGISVADVKIACGDPTTASIGAKFDTVSEKNKSTSHTYSTFGNYSAKVIVERGAASPKERRVPISTGKVDIKASASDEPVTVDAGTSVGLSWTSENVTSCVASGTGPNWSGSKPIGPSSQNTEALSTPGTYKYTLTCTNANGLSILDYVEIIVSGGLSIDSFNVISQVGGQYSMGAVISSNISGVTNNYTFYCNNSSSDTTVTNDYNHKKNNISEMTYDTPPLTCSYPGPGTYTRKVIVERGGEARAAYSDITILPDPVLVSIKIHPNSPSNILTDQDVTFKATGGIGGYKWSSVGGSPDKDQSGLNSEFTTRYSTPGFDKMVTVKSGTQTGTITFTVAQPTLTIYSLTAVPATGKPALDVSLAANVDSNIMNGTYNYTFWWNCDDSRTSVSAVRGVCGDPNDSAIGAKFDGVSEKNKSTSHTYSTSGNYTAKVIVERGDLARTARADITILPNVAPTVSPLAPAAPVNYCASPFDWVLRWNFSDANGDSQYSYQVVVNNADIGIVIDSGKVISSSNSYAIPLGLLSFNKTYNWAIKVWDSDVTCLTDDVTCKTAVAVGASFTTIKHAAPAVSFTCSPIRPAKGEQITCTDATAVSGGATISARQWILPADATLNGDATSPSVLFKFNTSGSKTIGLSVTDSDNLSCQKNSGQGGIPALNIVRQIPQFKEILPRF